MALTRGDKMIILSAVALAATVVLGLAILKRPYLFGRGKMSPAVVASAPTAATPPSAGPAAVLAPVAAPSGPLPPAAGAQPAQATPASPAPSAAPQAAPVVVAPPAAQAPAAGAAKSPAAPAPGDANLEKMFAEISTDAAPPAKPGQEKAVSASSAPQAGPEVAPAPASAAQPAPEPVPVEAAPAAKAAAAKGKGKAHGGASAKTEAAQPAVTGTKPAAPSEKAAAPAKAKPAQKEKAAGTPAKAPAKPAATAGNVIRIIAEEKPGEYELVIQTNKPPATFSKMFLADPPRMVLDIGGAWNYNGPLSSETGNGFVRHIRVGKHGDLFRVVLDMAPDAPTKLRGAPTLVRVPEGVALRIPK